MIDLRVSIEGLPALRKSLDQFSDRRFNSAIATALTRTAVAVRGAAAQELGRAIDRPTPYTQRQLRYLPARADRLVAAVGFDILAIQDVFGNITRYEKVGRGNTPASTYLMPNIDGGGRPLKGMERALRAAGLLPAGWFAVPGQGANIDGHGNMSRGQVIQILSQLRITLVAGATRNMSQTDARSAIRAQKRAGGRFFVPSPKAGIQPGVYQREFAGANITPVIIFVRRVTYRKRYDFAGITQRVADQQLPIQVNTAIRQAVARFNASR